MTPRRRTLGTPPPVALADLGPLAAPGDDDIAPRPLVDLEIPVRTVSESNAHEHWRARARRSKHARGIVAMALGLHVSSSPLRLPDPLPLVVTLTRVAPRSLDDDNLRGALKATRDGVADWLGVDDRDPRVRWEYAQRRGAPRTYAVRVEVRRYE